VRDQPTLCFLPTAVDELLQALCINPTANWCGLSSEVVSKAPLFQKLLHDCVKERFSWVFDTSSLALSSALFCPGQNKLKYQHFTITSEDRTVIMENITTDSAEVLTNSTKAQLSMFTATLVAALEVVDIAPAQDSSTLLSWWSSNGAPYNCILPLVKMLLAIPATSCENERSFRSAGLLLHSERTNLTVPHFQQEHRIQQFFTDKTEGLSAFQHRKARTQKANDILDKLHASTLKPTSTATTGTTTTTTTSTASTTTLSSPNNQ